MTLLHRAAMSLKDTNTLQTTTKSTILCTPQSHSDRQLFVPIDPIQSPTFVHIASSTIVPTQLPMPIVVATATPTNIPTQLPPIDPFDNITPPSLICTPLIPIIEPILTTNPIHTNIGVLNDTHTVDPSLQPTNNPIPANPTSPHTNNSISPYPFSTLSKTALDYIITLSETLN